MGEQQGTSRRSLVLSGVALVLAAVAFAAAFYFLDGTAFVADLMSGKNPFSAKPVATTTPVASGATLALPEGMPEEFALRMWQEQVDSQYMIGRLVNGEVSSLKITKVETAGVEASLAVTAVMTDKTSLSGIIGMRRFGDQWYVAFAQARRDGRIERPSGDIPSMDEVDAQLLKTIFQEQGGSQDVMSEYVSGAVSSIDIEGVKMGPSTATIEAVMHEDHGLGLARIVAIKKDIGGKPHWFLARFTKTGDTPAP